MSNNYALSELDSQMQRSAAVGFENLCFGNYEIASVPAVVSGIGKLNWELLYGAASPFPEPVQNWMFHVLDSGEAVRPQYARVIEPLAAVFRTHPLVESPGAVPAWGEPMVWTVTPEVPLFVGDRTHIEITMQPLVIDQIAKTRVLQRQLQTVRADKPVPRVDPIFLAFRDVRDAEYREFPEVTAAREAQVVSYHETIMQGLELKERAELLSEADATLGGFADMHRLCQIAGESAATLFRDFGNLLSIEDAVDMAAHQVSPVLRVANGLTWIRKALSYHKDAMRVFAEKAAINLSSQRDLESIAAGYRV